PAGVVDRQLVRHLEEALTVLGSRDGALRVRLLGRLAVALLYTGEEQRRSSLSQEAVETARRLGDPLTLVRALDSRHVALKGPANPEERLAIATEIVQVAKEAGTSDLELRGRALRIS